MTTLATWATSPTFYTDDGICFAYIPHKTDVDGVTLLLDRHDVPHVLAYGQDVSWAEAQAARHAVNVLAWVAVCEPNERTDEPVEMTVGEWGVW